MSLVEAAMPQAPTGPDARTLLVTDKSAAADGVVTLTLAQPSGGRLPGSRLLCTSSTFAANAP